MQTYPKAYNNRNEVVHVNEELPGRGPYTCLGCGAPMIAHLKDDKRAKHFAHRSKGKCSGETYLHVLAKHVFKHTWQRCRAEGKPFLLSLPRRFICPHMPEEDDPCEIGRFGCTLRDFRWPPDPGMEKRTEYDLARIYTKIKMEEGDAGFIPDLLLLSEDGQKKLYIEIKVKSAVSDEKAAAGQRIIEIPIRAEADIALIEGCYLSVPEVRPYNFKLDTPARNVPTNCEVLRIREQMRRQEEYQLRLAEARLREEEATQERIEAQERGRRQQEQTLLAVRRARLEAEGESPDAATEWSWNGHPIRILLIDNAWVLNVDQGYRGRFDTFREAHARAERIVGRFGSPVAGKVREVGLESPDSFVDEVIAVFGGRLLDDDE